jgi:hypothetical protein
MFTRSEKLFCIERELRMRRHVYPRAVAQRRMTQHEADRELAMMEEIAQDYREQAEAQPDLQTMRYDASDS